jgi:hypothetical protein
MAYNVTLSDYREARDRLGSFWYCNDCKCYFWSNLELEHQDHNWDLYKY